MNKSKKLWTLLQFSASQLKGEGVLRWYNYETFYNYNYSRETTVTNGVRAGVHWGTSLFQKMGGRGRGQVISELLNWTSVSIVFQGDIGHPWCWGWGDQEHLWYFQFSWGTWTTAGQAAPERGCSAVHLLLRGQWHNPLHSGQTTTRFVIDFMYNAFGK